MTITGSDFNKVYKDELYDYKTKTTDASKPSFSNSFFTLAANNNSFLNWTAMT